MSEADEEADEQTAQDWLKARGGVEQGFGFHPGEILEFLGAHFLAYSPFLFLAMALGLERASGWLKRMRPYQKYFKIASGVFIIVIGVLLLTNTMSLIAIWAFKNGYFIESFAAYAAAPTYLTAILAGLLSFLSPCVLPLVPAYLGYLSGHTMQKA